MRATRIMMASLVLAAGVLAAASLRAGSHTFLGTLVTVDNTTSNSVGFAAGSCRLPAGSFLVQNGGLTETNALVVNIQASIDNTNWLTVATYYPAATNATTEVYAPSYSAQTIYLRAQAVTTNSVDVGLSYQY